LLEKQSGKKVKAVRSDRGGEYVNAELKKFFASNGIRHETTTPYTPQQNGAAERLNRTLMERVRAMLNDS
jgi:transposase InsO family protein